MVPIREPRPPLGLLSVELGPADSATKGGEGKQAFCEEEQM